MASDAVQVFIRVRPQEGRKVLTTRSDGESGANEVILDGTTYTFDHVGDEGTTQSAVFKAVGVPIVEACLAGYNSTIFAYGQTGAGKTHTMYGNMSDPQERGLMPRVLERMFDEIEVARAAEGETLQCDCRCSLLEIYNEHISDLLDPSPPPETTRFGGVKAREDGRAEKKIVLREDAARGICVDGVKEEAVATAHEALQALNAGLASRHVGSTAMNATSSRSHTVFTLNVQLVRVSSEGVRRVRRSQLHLVDLAGSERQKDTHASGVRLREACAINQSLSTLGNCIKALVSGQTKPPFRESKLTFLLKDSLGGNAKTCIVANVSALDRCCAETLGTLRFAQRAKMMPNRAVVNEESHGSIVALREEIARLRALLECAPMPDTEARAQSSDDCETRIHRLQELLRGTIAQQQDLQDERDLACKRQRAYVTILEVKQKQVLALRLQLRLREEKLCGLLAQNTKPAADGAEAGCAPGEALSIGARTLAAPGCEDGSVLEGNANSAKIVPAEVAVVEPWPTAQLVHASLECELLHERNRMLEHRLVRLQGGEEPSRMLRQKEQQVISLQAEMLLASRTTAERGHKQHEALTAAQLAADVVRAEMVSVKSKHDSDMRMLVAEYEKAIAAILSRRGSITDDGPVHGCDDSTSDSAAANEVQKRLAQAEIALSLKCKALAEREAELAALRQVRAAIPSETDATRQEAGLRAQLEHERELARVAAQEAEWTRGRINELESNLIAARQALREEEAQAERLRFQLTMREEDEYDLSEEVDLLRSQIAAANERIEEHQDGERRAEAACAKQCVREMVFSAIANAVAAFPSEREVHISAQLDTATSASHAALQQLEEVRMTSSVDGARAAAVHIEELDRQGAAHRAELEIAQKAVRDAMAVLAVVEAERDRATASAQQSALQCAELQATVCAGLIALEEANTKRCELEHAQAAAAAAHDEAQAYMVDTLTAAKLDQESLRADLERVTGLVLSLTLERDEARARMEAMDRETISKAAALHAAEGALVEASAAAKTQLDEILLKYTAEVSELRASLSSVVSERLLASAGLEAEKARAHGAECHVTILLAELCAHEAAAAAYADAQAAAMAELRKDAEESRQALDLARTDRNRELEAAHIAEMQDAVAAKVATISEMAEHDARVGTCVQPDEGANAALFKAIQSKYAAELSELQAKLDEALARAATAEEERNASKELAEGTLREDHHHIQTRLQTSLQEQREQLLLVMQKSREMAEASAAEAHAARENKNLLEDKMASLQVAHEALATKEAEQSRELARLVGHTNHAQKIQVRCSRACPDGARTSHACRSVPLWPSIVAKYTHQRNPTRPPVSPQDQRRE